MHDHEAFQAASSHKIMYKIGVMPENHGIALVIIIVGKHLLGRTF